MRDRVLLIVLAVLVGGTTLLFAAALVISYPRGVDLEIPLRAAERWQAGQPPYLPAPPGVRVGPTLPYLYPPFLLPLLTPLLTLPREPLMLGWSLLCLIAAVYASRRLGIPLIAALATVLWPPYLEGILGGNVQVVLFAAFVIAFWRWPAQPDWRPRPRDADELRRLPLAGGLLAALVGWLKVTQVHAWLLVLRAAPRAAASAAVVLAVVVLVTIAATGVGLYGDWLSQLSAASNPQLGYLGSPLAYVLPPPWPIVVLLATLALVWLLPLSEASVWVGILIVVGSPSLQSFGWLFLLPAVLTVRPEVGLVAAGLLATDLGPLRWLALAMVVVSLLISRQLASKGRAGLRTEGQPWRAEPERGSRSGPG